MLVLCIDQLSFIMMINKKIAEEYKEKLYKKFEIIHTEVVQFKVFKAEDYHQNYYKKSN